MIFLVIISLLQEVLAVAGEGERSVLQDDITPILIVVMSFYSNREKNMILIGHCVYFFFRKTDIYNLIIVKNKKETQRRPSFSNTFGL